MIIAHLTNALRNDGTGITNSVVDLSISQADDGDSVWVVCSESEPGMVTFLEGHGVRVITSPRHRSAMVRDLLRGCTVIHVHTVRGMLRAAANGPLNYWSKSVSTFHNPHQRTTLLLVAARRVVALNARDAERLNRWNPWSRAQVVGNSLLGSKRLTPPESVRPEPLPTNSVVFVGALHRRKGLDVLLTAVSLMREEVPDVSLYVVGNRDAVEFEQMAVDLGIADRTTFVGFQPDPRGYMSGAGVFVLPSRDEGFGNVIAEARSVGAPIVASRVGGIPEALSGGRAGSLVPPGDPRALAKALGCVLTDEHVRNDLKRRARLDLESLTVARFRDDYSRVYMSLRAAEARVGVEGGRRP